MQKNLFLQLCEVLHLPHTRSYTNCLFEEHPYKYTLFGLSRLLAEYGIESQGFRFSDKLETLSSLEGTVCGTGVRHSVTIDGTSCLLLVGCAF